MGREKSITFKKMFDEISPGYYEVYYGSFFSEISHGGAAADIFRYKTDSKILMIPEFDKDYALMFCHDLVSLLYGYLFYYKVFFKDLYDLPIEVNIQLEGSISWLKDRMDENKRIWPKSLKWYKYMDKIIGIS